MKLQLPKWLSALTCKRFVIAAIVFPLALHGAIPQIFLDQEKAGPPSVLPTVRRPAQDNLEKVEDIVIAFKDIAFRYFSDIALQKTLNEGAKLALSGELDESFFERSSRCQSDAVFFRQVYSRLNVRLRGSNVVAKIIGREGPVYCEAKTITLSVRRTLNNLTPLDVANGKLQSVEYVVGASLNQVRKWQRGHWTEWEPRYPLSQFELVVFPILDKQDFILHEGKPKFEVRKDFSLAVMRNGELPSEPVKASFPLLKKLQQFSGQERIAGLQRLANANGAEAQYLLGYCLEHGRNVPVNTKEAHLWFERSAHLGFAPAAFHLAKAYLAGTALQRDEKKAMSLLTNAMNQAHLPSLALLGSILANDRAFRQTKSAADGVAFLEFAARKQDPIAMYGLARRSIEASNSANARAIDYLLEATGYYHAESAFYLGTLARAGTGLPQSNSDAWRWFLHANEWSAREKGSPVAKLAAEQMLELRDRLSAEQIAESIREIAERSTLEPREESWDP